MQGTVNLLESRFGLNWSLPQPDTIGTWLQQQTNVLDASWCFVKLLYIGWGQGLRMNPSSNHCMFRAFSPLQLGATLTLTSNAAAASILQHLVCPRSPQMQLHKGQPCHSGKGRYPFLYMRSPGHCSPCCWMANVFSAISEKVHLVRLNGHSVLSVPFQDAIYRLGWTQPSETPEIEKWCETWRTSPMTVDNGHVIFKEQWWSFEILGQIRFHNLGTPGWNNHSCFSLWLDRTRIY